MQANITKANGDSRAPAGPAVPSSLKFGQWATLSAHAEKDIVRISATNEGTFNPSTNQFARFRVKVEKGFTDISNSYFECVFKNTSGVDVQLDGGANALMASLKITNREGAPLEDVRGANILSATLKQYTAEPCQLAKVGVDEMFLEDLQVNSKTHNIGTRDQYQVVGRGYNPDQLPRLNNNVQRRVRFHPPGGFFNPKLGKQLTPGLAYDLEFELAPAVHALTHRKQLDFWPEDYYGTTDQSVAAYTAGVIETGAAPATFLATNDYGSTINIRDHGLAAGDQIMIDLNGNTWTDIDQATPYYVIARNDHTFVISSTAGATYVQANVLAFTVQPTMGGSSPISIIKVGTNAGYPTLNYELSELRLMMPTTKILDPELASMIASNSAKRTWTSDSYILSTHQIPAATQDALAITIPSSERVLKGFFCVTQESGQRSRTYVHSNSVKSINYFTEWQLDKNGVLIPERKVEYASGRTPGTYGGAGAGEKNPQPGTANYNISEGWMQAISLFGNKTGLVTASTFGGSEDQQGCGVLAVNLQPFPGDASIISGVNTQMTTGQGDMRLVVKTINAPLSHLAAGAGVFGGTTLVGTMWCFRVAAVAYFVNEMGQLQARI